MSDQPDDPAETAIQRALRMKTAAREARPKTPGGGKVQPRASSGMPAGASKPWMKK